MTEEFKFSKRAPNPPRRCIFCGGAPISKEHIYPAWMREYLRPGGTTRHTVLSYLQDGADLYVTRDANGPLHTKGDHRSKGLKVVCKTCNETWMSQLQQLAKPALVPLIEGRRYNPTRPEQRAIAAWATMFTMVYERADPETAASTPDQLSAFMKHRRPPKNWMVWVGEYSGTDCGKTSHRGFSVINHDIVKENNRLAATAQATVGIAGRMAFLTFSTSVDEAAIEWRTDLDNAAKALGFIKVWPTTGLRQQRSASITDEILEAVIEVVTKVLSGPPELAPRLVLPPLFG